MVNIAFAFFGPLGAAGLVIGDWMLNAFLVGKVVEHVVPNGPAIVGNFTAILPVLASTVYSAVEPALQVNYTGVAEEFLSRAEFGEWASNMTKLAYQMMNSTTTIPDL